MKTVAVIGGGIAGMEAAAILSRKKYKTVLIERNETLGGNLANWDRLFPTKRPAHEVLEQVRGAIPPSVEVLTETHVQKYQKNSDKSWLYLSNGKTIEADAVLLTTGFRLFNAARKEEYGYGIYDNVYTNADLEKMFSQKRVLTKNGEVPRRIGFIHCVGSRDEKIGNRNCSKVCCVTAVKQAAEIKELYPESEVYCFYMDLRMFARHYESMYLDAQKNHGVKFIRGRLSEAAEDIDHRIIIKTEDTLTGRPLKVTLDMLVLMAGMEGNTHAEFLADELGLQIGSDRFFSPEDDFTGSNLTRKRGIFLAGACTGPKTIPETLADARGAALAIESYLCMLK